MRVVQHAEALPRGVVHPITLNRSIISCEEKKIPIL